MKFSKKANAIFFIKKDKGTFYSKSLSKPANINFPEDVISHLEIVNNQKLEGLINDFIDKNKIEQSPLYLLLGEDTTFEKDLSEVLPAEKYSATSDFLDIVPFEETQSKTFKIQKKEKIIAANKSLSQALMNTFEDKGFETSGIIPVSIIKQLLPKVKEDDLPTLLKKIDSVKKYSLQNKSAADKAADSSERPKNIRLIVLSVVFAILILILLMFVYFQYFASQPKKVPFIQARTRALSTPVATSSASSSAIPSFRLR